MKKIKCASCERLNPSSVCSSVCFLCRQYVIAFLNAGFDPSLTVAYVRLRRRKIEGLRGQKKIPVKNMLSMTAQEFFK
jgi:hypothetical protein